MMSEDVQGRHKEYGGFLPLELNPGKEYYSEYASNMMRFNSFKAALCFLLNKIECKKIMVPHYYCPTTINAIRNCNLDVKFYHIDDSFLPCDLEDESESVILLVDYFGISRLSVDIILNTIKRAKVIIDNAHAFFAEPVMRNNIYNLYSAKKFFGVPDGAYLISSDILVDNEIDKMTSCSLEYNAYLIKTYELGTNAAYQDKKNADKYIAKHYAPMSTLALGLLKNVNYNRVKKQRMSNYTYLQRYFSKINDLLLTSVESAYLFPLLLCGKGRFLKNKLVKKNIYVPTLWNDKQYVGLFNSFEVYMAQDALFLPIDQRYNKNDMEYLANCVRCLL